MKQKEQMHKINAVISVSVVTVVVANVELQKRRYIIVDMKIQGND